LRNPEGRTFSDLRSEFPRSEFWRHLFCAAGLFARKKKIKGDENMSNEQVMKTVTKYTGSHAAPRNRKQRLDASTKNKKKTKNKNKNPTTTTGNEREAIKNTD